MEKERDFCQLCSIKLASKQTVCPLCRNKASKLSEENGFNYPVYLTLKSETYYWKKTLNYLLIIIMTSSLLLNVLTWHIHPVLWSVAAIFGCIYLHRIIILTIFDATYKRIGKFLWLNFLYLIGIIMIGSFILSSLELVINILFPIMTISIIVLFSFLLMGKKPAIYKDTWYLGFTFLSNIIYFFIFFYLHSSLSLFNLIIGIVLVLILGCVLFFIKYNTIKSHLKRNFYK